MKGLHERCIAIGQLAPPEKSRATRWHTLHWIRGSVQHTLRFKRRRKIAAYAATGVRVIAYLEVGCRHNVTMA